MPTILDKDATVALLRGEFRQLADVCAPLDAAQWDTPTCLPGWSVRDVLSHVIGAEAALLGEPAPSVDVTHLTHMKNPIAEANEVWVEANRGLTGGQMLARLEEVTSRRLAALDAMSQADFDAPSWTPAGRDETYGRFMRIRHYDCYLHEQDIRLALGQSPRATAADLTSSLDEVATGLGYIVGRRAGMPDGSAWRSPSRVRCPAATTSRSTAALPSSMPSTAGRPSASSCRPCASCASPGGGPTSEWRRSTA